ncbi:MAG: hypothetical protein CME71_04175 [Halobacteriovorax sp.]|nr:hypothetical protein [Halobacteriovorax sp.]
MYIMNTSVLAHNFDRLRHFVWVYEAGSFLGAAKLRGIGQPQLSRSIKALEEQLGVELFTRSSSGLTASVHALMLYELALKVLSQLSEFEQKISKDNEEGMRGRLSLGTYSSISRYLLPKFYDFFDVLHPELELALSIGRSKEIKEKVEAGKLDLGIVVDKKNTTSLVSALLYEDDFSFYQSNSLKPKRKDQLILYEEAALQIPTLKRSLKARPSRQIKVDSFELAYQLVSEGLGVALLPGRVARQAVEQQVLVKTKWRDMPLSFNRHQIFLIHKKRTQAILDFESSLREFLELYF